ncbi:MAG TPA: hypothetical protein VHA77_11950 [Xanthobacteraceae bacterium]|nr:hypothetical protein [Xanthobacteraceae bacterium]
MSPPVERLVRRLDEFLGSLFVQGLMMLTLIVLVVLVAVSANPQVLRVVQVQDLGFIQF